MHISAVLELAAREKLPPLQVKALGYLESHPDEVFSYRDEQLASEIGAKPSALGFTLWALEQKGLIEKEKVAGKVYFGSREAIADLRNRVSPKKGDAFQRAVENADRIREKLGHNLNSLEVLDELRSYHERR